MTLSWDEWVAIASVALPLIAKAATDYQANTAANHNAALVRIVGMAGRCAANISRSLAELPAGTDRSRAEAALIESAGARISSEMAASIKLVGGNDKHVQSILQGELDKVLPAASSSSPLFQPSPRVASSVGPLIPAVPAG